MSLSFIDFMRHQALSDTLSPLTGIAISYWQDWHNRQPIDGGVSLEAALHKLPLDGSLASLAVLDQFLLQAKDHLARDLQQLIDDSHQRNLLLFIAFYSGWVFAYHANQAEFSNPLHRTVTPQWLSAEQLIEYQPTLPQLSDQRFGYSVAISLLPLSDASVTVTSTNLSVFFPLITILARLYPQLNLSDSTPLFDYISDSLYVSVHQLLKRWQHLSAEHSSFDHSLFKNSDTQNHTPKANIQPATSAVTTDMISSALPKASNAKPLHDYLVTDLNNPLMERKDWQTTAKSLNQSSRPIQTYQDYVVADFSDVSMIEIGETIEDVNAPNVGTQPVISIKTQAPTAKTNLSVLTQLLHPQVSDKRLLSSQDEIDEATQQADAIAKRQAELEAALANPHLHDGLLNQSKSLVENIPPAQDNFDELEQDLAEVYLPETFSTEHQTAYHQAVDSWQQRQTADVVALREGYAVIAQQANDNLPDAMLRQALCYLRGDTALGIVQDQQKGLSLVQAAATLQDNRAEKLLSKLYFSGELVAMDNAQGKFWLAQAATHGHAGAQQLQQSFAMVNELKETRQDETDYLKKLAIGTGLLLLLTLVLIFAIKV